MLFNRARAIELMRRCGVDVLVATTPINITYFSDYYSWADALFKEYMMSPGGSSDLAQGYAVFPVEGEPALVIGPLMAINAAETWVRDLHIFGATGLDHSLPPEHFAGVPPHLPTLVSGPQRNATPTGALLSILDARGLRGARIGLEKEGLTRQAQHELEGALPQAAVLDCTNLIRLIRSVKSSEEITRLTRSAQINELAGMEALALAQPGRPVQDLARHYRARVADLGADFDHFAFSIRGLGIATEPDYVLTEDDLLFVDFGCLYSRYFSDTGTTLALREPPRHLLERHAALRACIAAGAATIMPGANASSVRDAMWQTLQDCGITRSFPHGHGFGLDIRDYPILVAENGRRIKDDCVDVASDLPLEVDMIFNLEAAIFMPGVGAVHMEKTFHVTADGYRPLVDQDRAAPFVPAQVGVL